MNEIVPCGLVVSESFISTNMLAAKSDVGTTIKIEMLDMPGIYHYLDKDFVKAFKALNDLQGYQFFQNKAVKTLIDFNFPLTK